MACVAGLFGGGDEDDWMTGSVTSKSSAQASKKPRPPVADELFGEEGEEEEGDLFDEPPAKKPSEPKKKVHKSHEHVLTCACIRTYMCLL